MNLFFFSKDLLIHERVKERKQQTALWSLRRRGSNSGPRAGESGAFIYCATSRAARIVSPFLDIKTARLDATEAERGGGLPQACSTAQCRRGVGARTRVLGRGAAVPGLMFTDETRVPPGPAR